MAENIGALFNTKMPGYDEAADIQAALKLYHYGSTTYDTTNTNVGDLINPSMAYHLQDIHNELTILDNRGIGSAYAMTQPTTPEDGFVWVDGSSIGNGGPVYSAAVYSAVEPTSPVDGTIWVDKNSTPPLAKVYNAGTLTWDLMNPLPALVDATGDLVYASSDNNLDKLSIGLNGEVLKVVSGLPAWASEKAWIKKSFGTMSGSSMIDVSGLNGERLYIILKDWSHNNAVDPTVILNLRFNGDSGPNYVNTGGLISASALHTPDFPDTGTHDLAFSVDLANTASALKPVATIADNTPGQYFGYYKNVLPITSLQITISPSGTFDTGSYEVWSYE